MSWTETHGPYLHSGLLIPKMVHSLIGAWPKTLLDAGGGGGTVGHGVWPTSTKISVLDAWPPKVTPANFTLGSVLDVVSIYGAKVFDVTIFCEVIEHLVVPEGYKALEALEAVTEKLVILTTPNGFQPHGPTFAPNEPWADNPLQEHLSGWTKEMLQKVGYSVYFNNGHEQEAGAQLIAWKLLIG